MVVGRWVHYNSVLWIFLSIQIIAAPVLLIVLFALQTYQGVTSVMLDIPYKVTPRVKKMTTGVIYLKILALTVYI